MLSFSPFGAAPSVSRAKRLQSYARSGIAAVAFGCCVAAGMPARASYLFTDYLDPELDGLTTDYSSWDYTSSSPLGEYPFYAANEYPNYPTTAAPFGSWTTASAAGVSNPGGTVWASQNPSAFWNSRNPTITQIAPGGTAFVTSDGGIYSYAAPTSFVLQDTTTYNLGTVIFQFQTEGTLVNFSSIQLEYTNGSGTHMLSPNESIQEYSGSTSSYGGLTNRLALQWDLAGLSITSFQIVFEATSPSMSLQQALLDTASTYATVVPSSGNWIGGSGNWSNTAQWAQNPTNGNYLPQENANATFSNSSNATVTLDANHTVGELTFDTPFNTTINSPGGYILTSNTGISTTAQATGTYTINTGFALNALNLFHINAGTVIMNAAVSGNYSLAKDGSGTLILGANNTFSGDLDLQGGTLQLNGTNAYTGATNVLFGTLIVAANAGSTGALGNSTSTIALGADSSIYDYVGGTGSAILIDGDYTISRPISLTNGTFQQTLGAQNTTNGAVFSGPIALSTAANIELLATNSPDKVTFSGGMSGGVNPGTVTIDGLGTVAFSGNGQTYNYANATNVVSGTLRIESGAAFTGNGNVTVSSGAKIIVNGSLSGNSALSLNGGLLGGNGTIGPAFTLASGAVLEPGDGGPGTIHTANETWAGAGVLQMELSAAGGSPGTGWGSVEISGALSLTATAATPFKLELQTLSAASVPGLLGDFNPNQSYSWVFATASGGITGFSAEDFVVDTTGFQNSFNGTFSVSVSGDNLALQYLVAPEPSTASLLLSAGLLLLRRRRKSPKSLQPPISIS
jgi:autotransporter-associated beta strand protein